MIPNRQNKLIQITSVITGQIAQINTRYPGGPGLHFYHRALALRQQHPSASSFLASGTCVEILYAALVSWGMDSRTAEMKDFADFMSNLQGNTAGFQVIETASASFSWTNRTAVVQALSSVYQSLALMKTSKRLVSNSKCLHMLFPNLCTPMDTLNTLTKLYGSGYETPARFLEVLELSYDVIAGISNPQQYLDNQWNTCETKLVDNAILLL